MIAETDRVVAEQPGAPAPAGPPPLTVENVTKRFGERAGALTAVDPVSFTVGSGEFVSVIGPSGCGKSTLFHNGIDALIFDAKTHHYLPSPLEPERLKKLIAAGSSALAK
jgi:ABC-type glutathione transport system ATPase component